MILLSIFAFFAGIVTVLSPCILPILPIVLSSSIGGVNTGKGRPIGVAVGFIASFTFFTLFLSTLVRVIGVSPTILRTLSVFVIAGFGISLLIPSFQTLIELLFSNLSRFLPRGNKEAGFFPGFVIGLSLGLLWTPCVGPILASVISLALSGSVSGDAIIITFFYALGTAIPLFLIMQGGQSAIKKVPWLVRNTIIIQKAFGVLMILTAIGIYTNVDRTFQTYILKSFPQYGTGLTQFENNDLIKKQLNALRNGVSPQESMGKAPEIQSGGEWFNSKPLTLAQLKGKVVMIDFWTYTCINCQRTLPYVREWWKKYKDKGLVIIGVHSPEFEFEKDKDNLTKAINDFGLLYPIVQDNEFSTWRAYNNQYWPAKYIVDGEGTIRYTHFGEGGYDETEKVIQDLLKETGVKGIPTSIDNPLSQTFARTPETYVGSDRMENFSSPESVQTGITSNYSSPNSLPADSFAFAGKWSVMNGYAVPQKGSHLYFNFDAKEVYLVMKITGGPSKVKVYIDDKQQYFGEDNKKGTVMIDSDRLYKLVLLPIPGRHILRLEFKDSNVQLFAFTFG